MSSSASPRFPARWFPASAGFVHFSAVAGAILLHYFAPIECPVPLMMAYRSIAVQSANLFVLRNTMQWKGSLVFIVGGVVRDS